MQFCAIPVKQILAGMLTALAVCTASAQDYPTRPLRMVVPFAPGGATDILGRLGAQKLSELLGQPVVIENKPGGGTIIGTRDVLTAPADGYTLLLAVPTIPIMAAISKSANYKMSDLMPISSLASIPYVLSVTRNLAVTNLAELVTYAKANPGKLNAGVVGTGSASTLVAERFKKLAGIAVVDVPYTSAAFVMRDLIPGTLQLYVEGAPASIGMHNQGQIRVLAVTADARLATSPDIPTFRELGYPDMIASTWFALFVKARTPDAIVKRLGQEMQRAMNDPVTRDKAISIGATPWTASPEEFARFLAKDIPAWEDDARRSGIQVQ